MTNLNKIPVLDKGYVQLSSFAPSFLEVESMRSEFFRGALAPQLIETIHVFLRLKCPYFILIPLLTSGMRAISVPGLASDAFIPHVNDIMSSSLGSSQEIRDSMSLTIDSLMLNQKAYVKEGCNAFVASLTTPVSAYWEGIIFGQLKDWIRFGNASGLHPLIKEYQRSVIDCISVEYKNINDIIRIMPR